MKNVTYPFDGRHIPYTFATSLKACNECALTASTKSDAWRFNNPIISPRNPHEQLLEMNINSIPHALKEGHAITALLFFVYFTELLLSRIIFPQLLFSLADLFYQPVLSNRFLHRDLLPSSLFQDLQNCYLSLLFYFRNCSCSVSKQNLPTCGGVLPLEPDEFLSVSSQFISRLLF